MHNMAVSQTSLFQKVVIYSVITIIVFRLLAYIYKLLRPRCLAFVLKSFAIDSNKSEYSGKLKAELFSCLKLDQKQKQKDDIVILEIGAGTGANFKYFPPNVKVIAVEPNFHCIKYLQETVKDSPHINLLKIIDRKVEDLPEEVGDGSVDAVVCTYVLCSIDDVNGALKEIRRVLKPNGKFYFLEHVRDQNYNSWTHISQRLMYPILNFVADCNPGKPTWTFIDRAGFKELNYKQRIASKKFPPFLRPHIYGYATK